MFTTNNYPNSPLTNSFVTPLSLSSLTDLLGTGNKNKFNYIKTEKLNDGTFVSKFVLPGYEKDEIKIEFSKTDMYNGSRQIYVTAKNDEYGETFFTSIIPYDIDEKSTKATLKNGILKITFCREKTKSPLSSLKIEVA
jgi:HSP20 family molecular chaperone IbpA